VDYNVGVRYLHVFLTHSEHEDVRAFVKNVNCVESLENQNAIREKSFASCFELVEVRGGVLFESGRKSCACLNARVNARMIC